MEQIKKTRISEKEYEEFKHDCMKRIKEIDEAYEKAANSTLFIGKNNG